MAVSITTRIRNLSELMAADYDLLLLDEPLTGLDGDTRRTVLEIIRCHSAGKTCICVTHEPADAVLLDAQVLRLS